MSNEGCQLPLPEEEALGKLEMGQESGTLSTRSWMAFSSKPVNGVKRTWLPVNIEQYQIPQTLLIHALCQSLSNTVFVFLLMLLIFKLECMYEKSYKNVKHFFLMEKILMYW